MSFSDPLSVTIDATTYSLPKTSVGKDSAEYRVHDDAIEGDIKVSASHQYGKRTRRVLRIDHSKYGAVAGGTAAVPVSMSCYLVFDLPVLGYSQAEVHDIYDGFNALTDASSGALITKLLGGES
jgi:hypothetical protein